MFQSTLTTHSLYFPIIEMWTIPEPTGDKPTKLARNSLTMIDQQRAALFGGYDGKRGHNETYLLDLETLV